MTRRRNERARAPRGVSMVEVMAALVISALSGSVSISAYHRAIIQTGDNNHAWVAFTLAQQQMEILSGAPRGSAILIDDEGDAALPGTDADATCAAGADGSLSPTFGVDGFGVPAPAGPYELCWKVTDGSPSGSLKNVRVVATYPRRLGGRGHVLLQGLR